MMEILEECFHAFFSLKPSSRYSKTLVTPQSISSPRTTIFIPLCEHPQRRQWHPTPVLLPGKSHGGRSLVGRGPCGRWESYRTDRLHFHFHFSRIGEGNGNPLQCSWLQNPRDGGAWWAAVHGVVQSRTRLKRLSSSSMNTLLSSLPDLFPFL